MLEYENQNHHDSIAYFQETHQLRLNRDTFEQRYLNEDEYHTTGSNNALINAMSPQFNKQPSAMK